MQINVSYDQNPSSLPAGLVNAVSYAVNCLDTLLTANVTIILHVGYGEVDGMNLGPGALGESYVDNYVSASYSSVRSALLSQGAPGASSLPANSPLSGFLYMSPAERRPWARDAAASANYYVGFSSAARNTQLHAQRDADSSDQDCFGGVVEHATSAGPGLVDQRPTLLMDLFHYSSAAVHSVSTGLGQHRLLLDQHEPRLVEQTIRTTAIHRCCSSALRLRRRMGS